MITPDYFPRQSAVTAIEAMLRVESEIHEAIFGPGPDSAIFDATDRLAKARELAIDAIGRFAESAGSWLRSTARDVDVRLPMIAVGGVAYVVLIEDDRGTQSRSEDVERRLARKIERTPAGDSSDTGRQGGGS